MIENKILIFNRIVHKFFILLIDPEAILSKMQTDAGLVILDHVSSPKDALLPESINLKMPV